MAGATCQLDAVGELEKAGVASGRRRAPNPDGRSARCGRVELEHEFVDLAHEVDDIAADYEVTFDLRIEPGGAQECCVIDAGLAGGGEEFVAHAGRGLGVGEGTTAQRERQPHPSRAPTDVHDVVVGTNEGRDLGKVRVELSARVEAIGRCVLAPAGSIEGVKPEVVALGADGVDERLVGFDGCHGACRIALRREHRPTL